MIVIPAVDILGGKCVRLKQGNYFSPVVYSDNPAEIAKRWEQEGAEMLHVVDLDGAKTGTMTNASVIQKIVETVRIPVQVGGGIRTQKNFEALVSYGASRIVLGTVALEDKKLLDTLLKSYSEKIVVALDLKGEQLVTHGWTKKTNLTAKDFVVKMEKLGVVRFIYTDILRDGMMTAPNFTNIKSLLKQLHTPLIVSGGISSLQQVKKLKALGVEGIIIGKALYEGTFSTKELQNVN